jgi:DNA-binding transcriptional LysR family regulator
MSRTSIIPKPVAEYDLRLLRIFKSVVDHGGFAAAEVALGVTRSTISVHMSNLEQRMKLKLCLRGRGGFSLTEDGQAVYQATLNLFDSLTDFSVLVASLGQNLSGELVILCSDQLDGARQRKLAQVIQQLHDHSPELHLVLDGASIDTIEKSLLRDKIHIGLFPGYQHIEGLEYQTIIDDPIYLCCGQQHQFFDRVDSQISDEDLAAAPAIHPGVDIDPWGREQLKKLNLAARSYQFDTRKTMILSGRYLGYLPQSNIQKELNNGDIRIIKPATLNYQFNISMVSKKSPREVNKVELLQQILGKVFNHKSQ